MLTVESFERYVTMFYVSTKANETQAFEKHMPFAGSLGSNVLPRNLFFLFKGSIVKRVRQKLECSWRLSLF